MLGDYYFKPIFNNFFWVVSGSGSTFEEMTFEQFAVDTQTILTSQSSWCSQILHVNVKSFSFKNLKIFNFHFIQSFQSCW